MKSVLWLMVRCLQPSASRCRYAPQQSLTTVVPGSIHASITAFKVSAVLSGMGTRNVLSDSRSTPPNTHCPLTGWPLWYLRRTNFLIMTVYLLRAIVMIALVLQHGYGVDIGPSLYKFDWNFDVIYHTKDQFLIMFHEIFHNACHRSLIG